jgi:hypothetical protein
LFFLAGALFLPCKQAYSQQDGISVDSARVRKIEPRKALLYSAVFPGLGQIYNRKYWKVPIIYGIGGAVIYTYFYNQKLYEELRNAYTEVYYMDTPPDTYEFRGRIIYSDVEGVLYRAMDNTRTDRDYSVVGIAALYFLNIIDAMIDAHFYEYDVSNDLTFKLEPSLINDNAYACAMGLKLSIKF